MKRTANIATMPGRENHLERTMETIINQFDRIRVVCNNMAQPPKCLNRPGVDVVCGDMDMTDNGKFFFLDDTERPEYYFTLDDDILYPSDYADTMVKAIQTFHTIVTCHGRVLLGEDLNYYRGHEFHHCAHETKRPKRVDVCGTGVTAFDTRYFCPVGLWNHPNQRMSDVIFSHEAAKQNRKITIIEKRGGWIEPQPVTESIWHTEHKTNQHKQIEACNEIIKLRSSR